MSDSKTSGVESAAIGLITRAVEMDNCGRNTEALICYQEGIQLLLEVLKGITEEVKRQRFRDRISDYMARAEKLKQHVEKEKDEGKYHEQIQIEENSTGHSYEAVMGRFIETHMTAVEVDDPYIRANHQVMNFLRFCEMLVKSKGNVREILLTTSAEDNEEVHKRQRSQLIDLKASLEKHNVNLDIQYNPALHDREIRFDTGWIIKIGRGLDYFKGVSKFAIGFCDYDLRPTHKTTVDIFHRKHTRASAPPGGTP